MGTRALVLGGAGAMGREAVRDLALTSDFDEIVVADREEPSALRLVDELKDRRLSALRVDVTRRDDVEQLMHRADVVANCTTYHHGLELVRSAIRCRRPYVDLGGLFNTPRQLELGPEAEGAGVRVLEFLPPVGALETYFVPHSESHTVPRFLTRHPNHVSVRGSWHPEIMKAMRVFLDYGLTSEEAFAVDGTVMSPRTFLRAHLLHRPPALDSPVAFFLRVDVTGERDQKSKAISYRSAHPTDWGLAGTARMTGVPMSIALQALARGEVARAGVMGPEAAFTPEPFFRRLAERGVVVAHDQVPLTT